MLYSLSGPSHPSSVPEGKVKGAHVRGLKNPGHSGLVLKNYSQFFSVFVGSPGILVPLASGEF